MKTSRISALLFLFTLVLNLTITGRDGLSQHPDNTIFIDPPALIDEANTLKKFTININISFIYGLHDWKVDLRYNPDLLYTNSSLIKEGSFLKTGGAATFWVTPLVVEDYISLGAMINGYDSVDGSGTLANVTFMSRRRGETVLHLFDTRLNDINVDPIPHTSQDGYFRNIESTQIPKAVFTYTAQAYNATFNASSSYSPSGTIQNYFWFWGGSNFDSVKNTSTPIPVTSHWYPETSPPQQENANVRLIVTDSSNVTGKILVAMITFGIAIHDLAILSVQASPKSVVGNYGTTVSVVVNNKGNQLENTTLTVSYNATATQWTTLHTEQINSTAGLENRTITYFWNTTGYSLGSYAIKAEASPVQGEENGTNNILIGSMRIVQMLYSPVPIFDFDPTRPYANREVIFDASMSYDQDGNISSYTWDFGDSTTTTTTQTSTMHVYKKAGAFLVKLTVTDDDAISENTTQSITIQKLATATTISTVANTIKVGSTTTINGEVAGAESPVNVTIFQRTYGKAAWTTLYNLETDQNGIFSYNLSFLTAGAYQLKAECSSSEVYHGSTSNIILIIAKLNSTISLSADKAQISLGNTIVLSGSTDPAIHGAIVTVEYKLDNEVWNLAVRTLTDENGKYTFNWRPDQAGTYELKAKRSETPQVFESESITTTVTVAHNPPSSTTYAAYAAAIIALFAIATVLIWTRGHTTPPSLAKK